MNKKNLALVLATTGLTLAAGCADPCLDDGLSQDPGNDMDCPALASAGETESDSNSNSDTETNSNSDTESDTLDSMSESDTDNGTCTDGVQNGDETDVDCGGTACPACGVGQRCRDAATTTTAPP